ncbi:MAG: ABC transporter permease [Actinobacteria bacterium]|nr:ABC transporter permease [Actinomycetota bacterium]
MTAQLRAELLKQRSTATNAGLLAAALGLVLLAVLLHGFALPAERLDSVSEELMVLFGWGQKLGVLFAALLGAMSVTSEIRHGTIRPTLLVTPQRGRVVAAKALASMLLGVGFGLLAAALALGAGSAALELRGVEPRLDGADYTLFLAGGAAGAALWAVIGVGIGALVRDQVPTLIGICAWLLLVEGLLGGDLLTTLGEVTRFLPGTAAAGISGQDPGALLAPPAGLVLLALYAAAVAAAGSNAMSHRDVA